MTSQSRDGRGRAGVAVGERAVLAASAHLTDRDRGLVRMVGEHRVLTTDQLSALGFESIITARHRLTVLARLGVLRRFRPHREQGSAPWHYLLGPVGAALLSAEDADEGKWLTAVRADRQLALARSQRLAHLIGVNWLFAALAARARTTGGSELRVWRDERAAGQYLLDRLPPACGLRHGLPRPDGLGGVWAEGVCEVTFTLEYDTGSEHLPQLVGKLGGYGPAAESMASAGQAGPLLLFCFPGPRREQAARGALAACHDATVLRIATTAINPQETSPAGPVWLPLLAGWPGGRVALCALDTAIPDPWQNYRAERERQRERAEQAHRQALRASDPDGQDDDDFPLE
ncbi:MAG: replication-relaxation family protein [Streptosporangiaceae bacterium]